MQVRKNNFNLLRLVFAFLVIVSHGPELIDGDRSRELLSRAFGTYSFGEFSVNSFFILSGYLITASWISEPMWHAYLRKRLLRIVPGFMVAVLVSMLVFGPLGSPNFYAYFSPSTFFMKLSLLVFDYPGFKGSHYELVNGALWTIHYEFVCYILLGLIGTLGLLKRPAWLVSLFGLMLLIYSINIFLEPVYMQMGKSLLKTAWFVAGNHVRFMSFYLAGVVLYVFRERITFRPEGVALAAGLFFALMFNQHTAPFAMAIPWAYLLLWMSQIQFKGSTVFQKVDVSYGLYLYAWPIQQLIMQNMTQDVWAVVGLTTLGSLLAGAISWYAIEKPALHFKRQAIKTA